MKKIIIMLMTVMTIGMMSGCKSQAPATETEAATIPAIEKTEPETTEEAKDEDIPPVEESQEEKRISTIGVYQSEAIQEDVNGEYRMMTFTDEYNNEFVATVSEYTKVPETMAEGKTYEVVHSDMMTMSLPGIYPEVYEINEVEE